MSYAVCCVPVAPLRMEPDHKVEMVSQLLFGECCMVIDTGNDGWVKVVCKTDTYSGWCKSPQVQTVSKIVYDNTDHVLAAGWVNELDYNGQVMMVPFGSSLTAIKNGKIIWNKNEIEFGGEVWKPAKVKRDAETIQQIAFTFLNTGYVWGGRSVFGIDCSGFAQMVFKFLNYPLLRDAQHQATQGETVIFLQQARCGDLAFFDDETGSIVHVGILLNEHEIIHASGKVRIDKIDNQGIVNVDTGERTHKLRIIKRYF